MITTLLFKYNTETKGFSIVNAENLQAGSNEMGFSFVSSDEMSNIGELRFGYEIYKDGKSIFTLDLPRTNTKYHQVSRYPFELVTFEIEPGVLYKLIGWVEEPGKKRLVQVCDVPKLYPPQPFPSWKWNGEEWEAPVPKKFDKPYKWNEEARQWEEDPETPAVMFAGYEVE